VESDRGIVKRVAIVGGGPGGLLTANFLKTFPAGFVSATIFEASSRTGGKILTESFEQAPVLFEAGLAEFYDYSHFASDPLKELVDKLGLKTVEMVGPSVILGDAILRNMADVKRHFGAKSASALTEFYRTCAKLYSPTDYYEGYSRVDNKHPWSGRSFRDVLDDIPDEAARKYVEVATRSDLATEPHLTSGLNGLKNALMNDPRYLTLYSIRGGMERFVERLAEAISTAIRLDTAVVRVARSETGGYRLTTRHQNRFKEEEFDVVIFALPNYWLSRIEFDDGGLRTAMQRHIARYDFPAHYLRVTALFERPFWRRRVPGSYFMIDAFGGCCVYDEGARHPCEPYGVLGWLLPGNDALALSNLDDKQLCALALDSLPKSLGAGRDLFLEGKVYRWVGTVNGEPGGKPVLDMAARHRPDPIGHPNLFIVGDYLIDSTLNAVMDSAEFATDALLTGIHKERYAIAVAASGETAAKSNGDALVDDYFDDYAEETSYAKSFDEYFCEEWTCDLIKAIWDWSPPYKLLDVGSANGATLGAFAKKKVEAWGIENNAYIHSQTPAKWLSRNLKGDVRNLPFEDGAFDFVYETCLCYLPEDQIDHAIRELFRVCRVGVYCGSIATDMSQNLLEAEDLFYGVKTFAAMQEWSEFYIRNGFRLAVADPKIVKRIWKIEKDANEGYPTWYPDAETMRYCFFSKPDAPRQTRNNRRGKGNRSSLSVVRPLSPVLR
jgi:monoamine oxidase/ubiquinone/menaquinone biosynthesis C-methylase UbiE